MVPRYSRPEMTAIWSPENRYRIWFAIEVFAGIFDLGPRAEVSVKLSAFGQALPGGEDLSLELTAVVGQ